MFKAIEEIKAILPSQQIIIWTCENTAEQTGLRIVLYLLQNKDLNEVFELNTFKALTSLYVPYTRRGTISSYIGELASAEQLLQFYEQFELTPMNFTKRHALCDEKEQELTAA